MENNAGKKEGGSALKRFLGLFNFFDLALLIAAALLAVVLVLVTVLGGREDTVTVRYTVEATGFEDGIEKLIRVGDPVMDIIKKYDVGTIVAVDYEDTTRDVVDYDTETVVKAKIPGQVTAMVTIETEAEDGEEAYSVEGNYDLRVGSAVSIRSKGLSFSGTIVVVEEVSGDE